MKATYDDAKLALRKLIDSGHNAYLAGGCVRDMQLGLQPNDYDVTTSATPEEVQAIFDKTVPVGASFGVVKVIVEGRELDVATFRTDGLYSDNRRPDTVAYSKSAEEDVKRRDFTINALLMDIDGKITDYVGGLNDLKGRVLRTVGNPEDRFKEDSLRMLRAIRFSVRFRLDIDERVWTTIKAMSSGIKNVSKERVTDEMSKMFCHGYADRAYLLLRTSGLWKQWLPTRLDAADSWRTVCALARVTPDDSFTLVLAIIILDMYDSDKRSVLDQLTLTNIQRKAVESLLSRIDLMTCFMGKSLPTQRKMMQWEDRDLIIKLIEYEKFGGRHDWSMPYRNPSYTESDTFARMEEIKAMGWPGPLITGEDLITMGFIPGPVFSEILELVRDNQLDGLLTKVEEVKPFIISKFPATPRMEDGKLIGDTHFRRLVAQCPGCKRAMSLEVAKDPAGNILWSLGRDKFNLSLHMSRMFLFCSYCGSRKNKASFEEVVI